MDRNSSTCINNNMIHFDCNCLCMIHITYYIMTTIVTTKSFMNELNIISRAIKTMSCKVMWLHLCLGLLARGCC